MKTVKYILILIALSLPCLGLAEDFPQCKDINPQTKKSKTTNNVATASRMFKEVLGVDVGSDGVFQSALIEDEDWTGTRAKLFLKSSTGKADGTLQFNLVSSLNMNLAAELCQDGSDLQASVASFGMGYTLKISKSPDSKILMSQVFSQKEIDNAKKQKKELKPMKFSFLVKAVKDVENEKNVTKAEAAK